MRRGLADPPSPAPGALARRAYRRPVTRTDTAGLVAFYKKARTSGASFEGGIRAALERMLVDPDFLYRIESAPAARSSAGAAAASIAASAAKSTAGAIATTPTANGAYPVSDIELASRLSFFLWSSIPDEPLLAAAEKGTLRQPAELEKQVRRMLADARATALVTSFGAQWLFQRNLQMVNPDFFQFPDWDDNLRQSMARETELFLDSQIRSDRPLIELLTADYSFLNERLALHYGVPNVRGFRDVEVIYAPAAATEGKSWQRGR